MTLKKDNKIEKSNFLNEMRYCDMNLQEIRFLGIYLSKINARNPETRLVRFSVEDFRKIMELGRINIENLEINTRKLLQNVVTLRNLKTGGYEQFQLFKKCKVDKDENEEWYVEIDAHDEALPYFFEYKKNNPYFVYELWNTLRLNSTNQQRMYELLKQHQKQGIYTYPLSELRDLLFIKENEYPRFDNFKARVLETAKKELQENTDIKFEYELIKKGAKVVKIKFFINKNDEYSGQMTLAEFLNLQDEDYLILPEVETDQPEEEKSNPLELYVDACSQEFSNDEVQVLFDMIVQIIPHSSSGNIETDRFDYLHRKYNEMKLRNPKKSRFGYLKTIIKADFDD